MYLPNNGQSLPCPHTRPPRAAGPTGPEAGDDQGSGVRGQPPGHLERERTTDTLHPNWGREAASTAPIPEEQTSRQSLAPGGSPGRRSSGLSPRHLTPGPAGSSLRLAPFAVKGQLPGQALLNPLGNPSWTRERPRARDPAAATARY